MEKLSSPPAALSGIPDFYIYGEPSRHLDIGFLHVEQVRDRNAIHRGEVALHTHRQMGQITYWTGGSGRYLIEAEALDFSAPAASFVPSGVAHGFSIAPDADAVVVSVSDALLSSLTELTALPLGAPSFVAGTGQPEAWSRFDATIHAIAAEQRTHGGNDNGLMALLLATALTYLGRLCQLRRLEHLTPTMKLAGELRAAIDRDYRTDQSVGEYVVKLGTTRYQLERAATSVLGLSVKQAVLRRRLLEAKRLLLFTIRSVEEIAYEIGFRDPAYFSRFFTRHVGRPPALWRREEARRDGR
ncbi:helix-turn-helix domain-containing protein [Jiella pacifica]|uniref:Helix-turn-helix domain-containing protein n=1 Tax=Jiella pacifica TaxID=2696469 RepID=A0A6N9SZR5_9HYPH|nr:helix-turn-helix domain-containing protein [Jiella pacifica]NDW03435.1 helix-turn-helix domain-containing protein [Jiella pacifica]